MKAQDEHVANIEDIEETKAKINLLTKESMKDCHDQGSKAKEAKENDVNVAELYDLHQKNEAHIEFIIPNKFDVKAWEVAQAPFKNLLMMGFMMWMAGNTVHLFSIGITFSALWQPISALQGVGKDDQSVFKMMLESDIFMPRVRESSAQTIHKGLHTSSNDLTHIADMKECDEQNMYPRVLRLD
ncbi:hypothetical protein TEA_018112 [Camellia sinensis var. sinensis]|uniref:ER membrane protein complex subunit 4 n=1 Tax=Camellia sinensis var. sinensis TaxID=542762 RepID=A0A4S4DBU1_CAMSN|nr:hypothetical protein TEA_018112 [Camellia sinensis var. sinensis]